jgi:hypothetical protein
MRSLLGLAILLSGLAAGCEALRPTPAQSRVEDAWAACQHEGRIPIQVKLTRIETDGRYWISGDAGSFGFRDTQTCMQEKFRTMPR